MKVRLPMRDNATGDNFLSHFVLCILLFSDHTKTFTFTYIMIGPTKHRKELQDTENSAKNYKVLQGTTRYFQTKYKVAENTTRYF